MSTNEIYQKNMAFLKKSRKELYKKIENTNISHIQVKVTDGNINVFKNNQALFPIESSKYFGEKIESFINQPGFFGHNPTKTLGNKEISPIHDKYVMGVEHVTPEQQDDVSMYHEHLDSISFLTMFGLGTGQQIEQLINLIDIKTLIIIEEDYSLLKVSMHIVDWVPIFNYFNRPSYFMEFIISTIPENLGSHLINTIFATKPYLSYYTNYFITYETKFIERVYTQIKNNYFHIFSGWGFYDDELLSLKNTVKNINNKRPVFLQNKSVVKNSSVFLVASGPSIDQDIEYIKKYQNNVVIFSCGTGLKVLEANNIVPDYHFESERSDIPFYQLKKNLSKDFMKKVNFIGLNVIYPEVFSLFKTAKIFFRKNDGGSSIVPDDIPQLNHCNPTVTNAVLSFASTLNFKNIYLFGTDMGYKDESLHHSTYSIYSDKETKYFDWKPETTQYINSSNFDDNARILSTSVLTWCRQRVENCILESNNHKKKSINYYNCSDGAFIKGTIPLKSNQIDLDSTKNKDNVLQSIEKNFLYNHKKLKESLYKNFYNEKYRLVENIDGMIIEIQKNNIITSYNQFFSLSELLFSFILNTKGTKESSLTSSLLRGTLTTMLSTIYSHGLLAKDIEASFTFINNGFMLIVEFLNTVKSDISEIKMDNSSIV